MPKRSASHTPPRQLEAYAARRDFAATAEPAPGAAAGSGQPIFVVQKHAAARAGLHYDFRLEHDGVLWSWAVPKGPSLDPADKRMAIHVEDHPLDYATFEGRIAAGQYGAGEVEVWDHGTWTALDDADAGMRKGHLHFSLQGERLNGAFNLVRLPPRGKAKQEVWLLIKSADDAPVSPPKQFRSAPCPGAIRAALPQTQEPELCATRLEPPEGDEFLSEIKFDGYRLIVRIEAGVARLFTRNLHDWTERMPRLARAFSELKVKTAMLDGELVAINAAGRPDFGALQTALSEGRDQSLLYYAFDLLHLNGWDLRPSALSDRKALLRGLSDWRGALRYSDDHVGQAAEMLAQAASRGLEGIILKKRASPYRAGRGRDWVKVKVLGRAELVIIGWTPPAGSRQWLGALQLATYDRDGVLHYAGGVGTGFSDRTLADLRQRLDRLAGEKPDRLQVTGATLPRTIRWVRPELVAEISFTQWSSTGRLRHAVFLGLREDKAPLDVMRDETPAGDPEMATPEPAASNIVVARAPKRAGITIGGIAITHPSRELWPGITKQDLAEYWQSVAEIALPGIARRPLAILRCPDGIGGEQFFQKNRHGTMPPDIRDAMALKQPYLAIDDVQGLIALTQMSAIELHGWGATEADPAHPDRLVFDLDPGEGVGWDAIMQAARDVRDHLGRLNLAAFVRTSGGKGLHVVVPLDHSADWPAAKTFCRAFAETLSADEPKRFLAHTKIADRKGRILIDWLRNGPGATAICSFAPRARLGANVATPLAWVELKTGLSPTDFTLGSIPRRLAALKRDPWAEFATTRQALPRLTPETAKPAATALGTSRIVVARKPARRP